MSLEKGSEEWEFFREYFNFRKKYHDAVNGEEWFSEMMKAGESLMQKYSNMEFSDFVKKLVFDHFEDVDKRWRNKNE